MLIKPETIIDFLESQHREVEALFAQLDKADDDAKAIATTLAQKLLAHMIVEQTIVYPAFADALEDTVHEGYEEHEVARFALGRLLATRANHPTFDAKAKALRELIEHHVKEEEKTMFPKAKKALDRERLRALRDEAASAFESLVALRPPTLMKRAERVALLQQAS